MKALRVLLVTRRFWPLVGQAEDVIADLACGLLRRGVQTTVLTAQWGPDWPRHSYFDTASVFRLPLSGEGFWRLPPYLLALNCWLRRHRREFDLAVVARLRQDACTVVRALHRTHIPVVLRAEADDCAWHEQSLLAMRCRNSCRRAAAVIARDSTAQQILVRAGYAPSLLHTIPDGIPATAPLRGGNRFDARLALAAANGDLVTAADAPVVVCSAPLRRHSGLAALVRAWAPVVLRWPAAKLWLIGEGPDRDDLYLLIGDLDLRHSIHMPGTFEDADDVFRAANLFVSPERSEELPRALLAAAAAGLPVAARITPALQQHPTLVRFARLVASGDAAAWSRTIIQTLEEPPDREQLAAQRRAVLREHSMTRMIKQHLALFGNLVASRQQPS